MELVAIVIVIALFEYFYFGINVARARGKYEIAAPAMTGNPIFERHVRVQQNTLEQLVIFIPAILLFATYVSTGIAALLGLVFVVGRFLYSRGYVEEPGKRGTGFLIGQVGQAILLLGGAVGAIVAWL